MSAKQKETIYIDVDDEITAIIEKLHDSQSKIIALVLPKRCAVLQSTVNMRLLKRAAQADKKSLVLISSEASLLPLAGAVGLHVAQSLQSKPAIPTPPEVKDAPLTISDDEEADKPLDPQAPIGQLAGLPDSEDDETIEVDYDEDADQTKAGKQTSPINKKLKIPNFERFRLVTLLGGTGVIGLIIGLIWAIFVAPHATITIKTDTTTVTSSVDLTASPTAKTLDKDKLILPATTKSVQKTDNQKVSATGQKNNGTKASGTMTLTNCINDGLSHTVPAGTTFTSNQRSFVSSHDVILDPALYSGSTCKSANFGLSKDVSVIATQAGDQYNLSARSYTSSINGINAYGSAMTGGTSKLVKVVSQQDVDTAKQQLLDRTKTAAVTNLNKQFSDSTMFALSDSVTAGDQKVTATPNVGDEATDVTVNLTVTYTMLGVAQSDLKQVIEADIKQKIDPITQQILDKDDGLAKASVKLKDKQSNGDLSLTIQVQVTAGPQLDTTAIKQQIAGKKTGEAVDIIRRRPGIEDVKVDYSPFWVLSVPKSTGKISVVFKQANGR